MAKLPQATIIGSWKVLHTDVPANDVAGFQPTDCYFHFSEDFIHYLEYPFAPKGYPRLCPFTYQMTEIGVFITPKIGEGWELAFTIEEDCRIFVNSIGQHTRFTRITLSDRPSFLKVYYEGPGTQIG